MSSATQFRRRILFLVLVLLFPATSVGGDPGLVVVLGEPPGPWELTVPALSAYKLTYDPARIQLWDSVTKDNAIASGAELGAPTLAGDFEPDCDIDLVDFLNFQVCFPGSGGGQPDPGCEPFDVEPDGDVDLTDFTLFHPNVTGPACATVSVTVFVQGVTTSTALADTTVTLLTDPDGDGNFTVEATQPVTVVSIGINPPSGGLGSELTVTLQPAIPPLAFNSATSAHWEGVYQPLVGPPTAPFQVAYDAGQFRESSASEAVLVIGDGTITNAPDVADLEGPGSLSGPLTFNLAGLTLSRTVDLALDLGPAAVWESIIYLDNPLSTGPPALGGPAESLDLMPLSDTPDPLNPDETVLLHSYLFHYAAVVRIEGTATTSKVYSNTSTLPGLYLPPGRAASGFWLADDVRLNSGAQGCEAAGYEIAIYGGDNGPDYDAHVELFDLDDLINLQTGDCIDTSPEGTGIPDTAMDFFGLPGSEPSFLFVPLAVTLPRDLWVYVSVSTDVAGWIIAELPEIGGAPFGDCFAYNCDCSPVDGIPDDCGICFWFYGDPYASFWAEFYCVDNPETPSADAPPTVLVDLVSLDPAGVEIDRVDDVVLLKVLGDDEDPQSVVYHTNLETPVIFVDVPLNRANYPNLIPVQVIADGSVLIVAAQD